MTYEPGVLVRRQQREYPPELRKEIALAALEVGNNREVARLYSERLGYTVNESTVRGIKKRYLEGVQKGKIESVEERESEGEEANFQPEQVMKLQLEVLEGEKILRMKSRFHIHTQHPLIIIMSYNYHCHYIKFLVTFNNIHSFFWFQQLI